MLSFRSVLRARTAAEPSAAGVLPEIDEAVGSPLVPCNNLRGRWITAEDGKLELRWDLPEPSLDAVTRLTPRTLIAPAHRTRRSA
jgi:hypothetical protein